MHSSDHTYSLPATCKKLKIASLNVCGLRSKLRYDVLEDYAKDFDIVCLTETKTDVIEKNWFPNYSAITMPKKCSSHAYGGVHGICILVSDTIMPNVDIVEGTCSTNVLWIRVKNIADIVLGAVYLPCETSKHFSDETFGNLLSDLAHIEGRFNVPIIVCGDFNARTGLLLDINAGDEATGNESEVFSNVFDSIDHLHSLGIDMTRYNEDVMCNKNGYQLIECCKTTDLKIINGRFGSDAHCGSFTCTNANGRSVIDYVIASSSILPFISDFKVKPLDKCLSDVHSPIEVVLNPNTSNATHKTCTQNTS